MASKSKRGKHGEGLDRSRDTDTSARTIESRFSIKHSEEIVDIRISIGSTPVGGKGPRPKREVVLTATVVPLEKSPKPKGMPLPVAKATPVAGNGAKRKEKKKRRPSESDKPLAPVGGVGRKRRSPSP